MLTMGEAVAAAHLPQAPMAQQSLVAMVGQARHLQLLDHLLLMPGAAVALLGMLV